MSNQWLRLWHDMPTDPKWRTIARVSGQSIALVQAVYLHLLVDASRNVTRGHATVTAEDLASALDVTDEQIESVMAAMQGRVIDGQAITGWDRRQPKREDAGSPESGAKSAAQRKREQRARAKGVDVTSVTENVTSHETSRDGVTPALEQAPDALDLDALHDADSNAVSLVNTGLRGHVTQCHGASRNVTTDKDKDKEESKEQEPPLTPQGGKSAKAAKFDALTACPPNASPEAWAAYCDLRKAKRAPLTEKACQLIAKKLAEHPDPDAVLNLSTQNGWTGVFPEQVTSHAASQQNRGQGAISAVDAVKQAIAAREAGEALAAAAGQAVAQDGGDLRPALDGEFRRVG